MLATPIPISASSLFSLLSIDAAPLTSREHILIANILQHSWDRDESLDTPSIRHPQLARHSLYGQNLWLYASCRQPAQQSADAKLLKQARAFGLGVVLSTQNPVDLDYKGLSNNDIWLIDRPQTDRDKQR
jgi:hypothetical protein